MKIGFYDTDYAGGMIPMIVKLKKENIPYEKIDHSNLNLVKKLDLLIVSFLGLPNFREEFIKSYCRNIKKVVETNPNTKFLIMIPGERWNHRMNEELGAKENINYVMGNYVSKLTKLLEDFK